METREIDFNLETRNFENLVYFYASKLRRVLAGENVSSVFTGTERSKLVIVGILEYGKSRKDIVVSLKTQEILKQLQ